VTRPVAGDATILVIDDDPNSIEIVTNQIEQTVAYRVVVANGGQLGLDHISAAPPDLMAEAGREPAAARPDIALFGLLRRSYGIIAGVAHVRATKRSRST
jgi:hypothetical protein